MAGFHLSTRPQTRLHKKLIEHEGWENKPYRCPEGALTIGVGHNLDAKGLCDDAIFVQLDYDIVEAKRGAAKVLERLWAGLDEVRQEVLVMMVFQLGEKGVSRFRKMIEAIGKKDYALAAREMLDSRWAQQTPNRARELSKMMESGRYG